MFVQFGWIIPWVLLVISLTLYRRKVLAADLNLQEARFYKQVDKCLDATIEQCVQRYLACAQQSLRSSVTGTELALELAHLNKLQQVLRQIAKEKKTALTRPKGDSTEQEVTRLVAESEVARWLSVRTEQAQWELHQREQLRQHRHSRAVDPFTSKMHAATRKYEHRIKSSQLTQ